MVSNTLTVSNGVVSNSSGTIRVELPNDILSSDIVTTGNISVGGNMVVSGNAILSHDLTLYGNLTIIGSTVELSNISSQNANLGNLAKANYFQGNGSYISAINGANVTGTVALSLIHI